MSVAKVAEFQARGLVHFHAIFRLDGPRPGDDPPTGATADVLTDAVRSAAKSAQVLPPLTAFLPVVWGEQLDLRTVDGDVMTDTQVAGYIAKYATKGAGTAGTSTILLLVANVLASAGCRAPTQRAVVPATGPA